MCATPAPDVRPFVWGAATSAAQIEGDRAGRGDSVWDALAERPGRILDGSNLDVACDHVHRYRDDVELLHALGVDAYRFSIAWPRVLPNGVGQVNQTGLDFYDRLVDELLARGIDPWVTLYHWDLPLALHDRGADAVVQREQAGGFEHGRGRGPRPRGRHPRVDAGQQRQDDGQRDPDVHHAEQAAQPPRRLAEQREDSGVAEREHLPGAQVDEEPGDPGPVGVLGDERAEHQGQVEPGQPRQLCADHRGGEHRGGQQAEHRPACPVHLPTFSHPAVIVTVAS
jgi:hypothetical protein